MADPILHIKDGFFFEVPKALWPRDFKTKDDVYRVSPVWVELDSQYQDFEFHKQHHSLTDDFKVALPPEAEAHEHWHKWQHGLSQGRCPSRPVSRLFAEGSQRFEVSGRMEQGQDRDR